MPSAAENLESNTWFRLASAGVQTVGTLALFIFFWIVGEQNKDITAVVDGMKAQSTVLTQWAMKTQQIDGRLISIEGQGVRYRQEIDQVNKELKFKSADHVTKTEVNARAVKVETAIEKLGDRVERDMDRVLVAVEQIDDRVDKIEIGIRYKSPLTGGGR